MRLLTCLIAAVFSVVTIASPVPNAEFVDFPSPLNNGNTAYSSVGSYYHHPPPESPPSSPPLGILGGNNMASQDTSSSSVLGDSQDLSTSWGDQATRRPQSDKLSSLMYEYEYDSDSDFNGNGNLFLAQAHLEDQISSPPKSSDTQIPFQKYQQAECGGTKSVCCSGIGIDTLYNEQPGVPLPCSDSMQIFFSFFSPPSFYETNNKWLILHKENIKMIDAGYERFLWPGDSRAERYCLEPVYLSDCNTVFVGFFFLSFSQILPIIIIIIIINTTTVRSDLQYKCTY